MFTGYKTFTLALLMLGLCFWGVYLQMFESAVFETVLMSVSGMIGAREVADKLLTKTD